jgi:hypothetical protein
VAFATGSFFEVNMEIKLEISQKIVDDNYVNSWTWRILDENKNVFAKGEANTLVECYEPGRKALKKFQSRYEKNSLKDNSSDAL